MLGRNDEQILVEETGVLDNPFLQIPSFQYVQRRKVSIRKGFDIVLLLVDRDDHPSVL